MANLEALKEKHTYNNEAAEWAEKKQYFDVATSRKYYSLFQLLLFHIKKIGYEEPIDGKGSHEAAFNFLSSYIEKFTTDKDTSIVVHMRSLKSLRVKADYKTNKIVETKYNTTVKPLFDTGVNLLNSTFKEE